jgi:hypothetical protein
LPVLVADLSAFSGVVAGSKEQQGSTSVGAVGIFAASDPLLAFTAPAQNTIVAFVGVFNAAPTGTDIVSFFGTVNIPPLYVYDAMANSSMFEAMSFAYSSASTNDQFTTAFLNQLIGNAGTYVSSQTWVTAHDSIYGQLGAGASRGAAMKYMVDFLRATPTSDPNMGPAAQLLLNRIAVAADYANSHSDSATSLVAQQNIIASVTTSQASVTAAIAAYGTSTQPTTWTVSVSASPAAGGTVCCTFTGVSGSPVLFASATANPGYTFTNWTENGAIVSTSAGFSFFSTAARALVANFVADSINSSTAFTITGSVTGPLTSQTITASVQTAPADAGQSIGVYVAANVGNTWFFKGAGGTWTLWGGGSIPAPFMSVTTVRNTTNSFSVPVVQNMDLTSVPGAAVYVGYGLNQADMLSNAKYQKVATVSGTPTPQTFTLTVNAVGNGTVSVNPSASSYAPGTVVTLIGVPGAGYNFSTWSDSCAGSGAICTLTMNSNLSATATFVQYSPFIDFSLLGGQATVNQSSALPLVLGITGGNGDYHCQVDTFANGTPPFGMTVDNFAHEGTCQVVGTPTQAGTYNFGICVVDSAATQRCKQVTVIVSPAPTTSASVTISSVSCTVSDRSYTGAVLYDLLSALGSASGPELTSLQVKGHLGTPEITCASWTDCWRHPGEPDTTIWSGSWHPYYQGPETLTATLFLDNQMFNGTLLWAWSGKTVNATKNLTCPSS